MTDASGRPVLISGGWVLEGPPRRGRFERVDVLVEGASITAVGADLEHADAEVVDAHGCFVLPGFVDTHHHLWQTAMRGLTSSLDLVDFFWCIRRNHAGIQEPQDVAAATTAGALAALDCGTTTVLDHAHCIVSPDHADAGLEALSRAGGRAVWCYGLTEVPTAGPTFANGADRRADARRVRTQRPASSLRELVTVGLAADDVGGSPWSDLAAQYALADELDVLLTAHTNSAWAPTPVREVEWLHRDGLLGPRQVHSHATTSSPAELALLADAGAAISSTPETELQMGLGFPVFARAAAAGVTVGLGTDIQSNNSPDALSWMRLGMQAENARRHQPVLEAEGVAGLAGLPVNARDVLDHATLGGARALGLDGVTGSIEVGKEADLVLLRHDRLHHRPIVDPFATIVLHSRVSDVDTVFVAGRIVKRAGLLPPDEVSRAIRGVDAAWERLQARMDQRGGAVPPRPPGLVGEVSRTAARNAPPWVANGTRADEHKGV